MCGYLSLESCSLRLLYWSLVLSVCLSSGSGRAEEAASPQLIDFPTSCSPRVAAQFNRAVELLHSFEYPLSEAAFRAILDEEPGCAMARWGVAMNQWHPLWDRPAEAALESGSAMLADIDLSTVSAREAGYVGALRTFYDDHQRIPHQTRALKYQRRMQQVYADHLDDPEAAAFYALALLATADPTDKTYCQQFKAAGVLNWVRIGMPDHPGALHYLIHSYDYPGLAHLALDAAMNYAGVARDSAHAQHMPSHIFTRLGLWDRSIASNHDATASAAEYTQRASLPGHYDEGIHSMDYLMYALLQTADDDGARQLLDRLRSIRKAHPENFKIAYTYAASPARYTLERRDWEAASRLDLFPRDLHWEDFGWARSIHHFARGIGSVRSGQLDLAKQELNKIRQIAQDLPADTLPYWREEVFVHADAVASWIALAEGDSEAALRLAGAAADREDAVDKHPVTPGEVLPARELLGDMLLQLGMPTEALSQYRQVLARSPNRLNALMGAARASVGSGETDAAASYYDDVVRQTASRGQVDERLREARDYLSEGREPPF